MVDRLIQFNFKLIFFGFISDPSVFCCFQILNGRRRSEWDVNCMGDDARVA